MHTVVLLEGSIKILARVWAQLLGSFNNIPLRHLLNSRGGQGHPAMYVLSCFAYLRRGPNYCTFSSIQLAPTILALGRLSGRFEVPRYTLSEPCDDGEGTYHDGTARVQPRPSLVGLMPALQGTCTYHYIIAPYIGRRLVGGDR